MQNPLRILHIPGRTPYARKLRGDSFSIINETTSDGVAVPRDASFEWVRRQPSLDFFDVLHIQSVELAELPAIEEVLQRAASQRKGIVLTIHDVGPLFPDEGGPFSERINLACQFAKSVVTLTDCARQEISSRFGLSSATISIIPHGSVLPISHRLWTRKSAQNQFFSLGMFGGVRPNRSFLTAAVNALYGLEPEAVRVKILSRGLNPIELAYGAEALQLANLAASDSRLSFKLSPFPDDDEVADFVSSLDVLVLPYLFGTHSGQLELAMDLGVRVIAPGFGCYRAQWQIHSAYVPEPFWFECNPSEPYSYGAPLLQAMKTAYENWQRQDAGSGDQFRRIREREEAEIIRLHKDLYERSLS
jgi:hypothetical protein